MVSSISRIWLKRDGNFIETTITDSGFIIDKYESRKKLLKNYFYTLRSLLFRKTVTVYNDEEFYAILHEVASKYFPPEKVDTFFTQKDDTQNTPNYIG